MTHEPSGVILLVEDSSVQRQLYGAVLSSQDYTVLSADSVKAAEEFLLSDIPTLILLDIMMPEVDGLAACRRFRKTLGDRIPILFLTAADAPDVVLAALKAGGDDYVVKAGSPSVLIERIRHWQASNLSDLPARRAQAIAYLEARVKPQAQAAAQSFSKVAARQH